MLNSNLPIISDASVYNESAKNIVNGLGYISSLTLQPTAHYSPGYPYFISFWYYFFGNNEFLIRFINVILGTVLVFEVYYLSKKLINKELAYVAAALMCFFPSQIFWCNSIMSETLFNVLGFLILIILFSKIKYKYLIAGITYSLFVLVRSQGIIILPLLIYLFLYENNFKLNKTIKSLFIFSISFIIVLSPWLLRNYIVFDHITFTTNSGVNFFMGVFPEADGTYIEKDKLLKYVDIPVNSNEYEVNKIYLEASYKYILSDLNNFLFLIPKKLFVFLRSDLSALEMSQYVTAEKLWNILKWMLGKNDKPETNTKIFIVLISQLYYMFVFLLAFISLAFYKKEYRLFFVLCFSIIVLFCLFHSVYVAPERYRAFLNPVLAVLASFSIIKIQKRITLFKVKQSDP